MRRVPANQTEALNTMQSHAFVFRNICFDGRGSGIGLDLAATYGASPKTTKWFLDNANKQVLTPSLSQNVANPTISELYPYKSLSDVSVEDLLREYVIKQNFGTDNKDSILIS